MSRQYNYKLSVVSPCYNEEAVIEQFYHALKGVLAGIREMEHEILLVDDGSSDGTLARLNSLALKDDRLTVVSLSRNFGQQIALSAGMDYADADAVILMDSDLQHPPELIPEMVRQWRERNCDIVSAIRKLTPDSTLFKRISSKTFYLLFNLLSDVRIEPGAADFCLLSRRAQTAVREMPERHRFLRGIISWIGFKRGFVPYEASARAAGSSKYTLKEMITLGLTGAFSFSAAPIKLASRLGAFVCGLGAIYLVYVLIRAIWFGDLVQGWGSLMSVLLILGGLNFTLIGLIGGYLGRVYEESKRRPLYFVKQEPPGRNLRGSRPTCNAETMDQLSTVTQCCD